jgi:ribonuclease HI
MGPEALAIWEGLCLADDLLIRQVRIASDCQVVVKAMEEENLGRYSHILHEIKALSMAFE